MRRILLAVSLLAASLTGVVGAVPAQASTTVTFNYTGSAQTWTVPGGVTSVDLTVNGGGGGGSVSPGGSGARVEVASLSVTPGETFTFRIGGGGQGSVREITSAPLLLAQKAVPSVVGQNDNYEPGAGGGSTIVEYSADGSFFVVAGGGGGSVGAVTWNQFGPALLTLSGGAGGRTGGDGAVDEDREFSAACGEDTDRCSKGGTSAGIGGLAGTYAGSGGNWPNGSGGWSGADGTSDRVTGGQPGGPGGAYSDPSQNYNEHGGSGGAGYGGGSGGSSRSGGAWGGGGGGSSYASVSATFTTGGGGAGGVAFTDLGTPTPKGIWDEYGATNPGADGSVTITYTFNAPTITAISPDSGPRAGGQSVTITGTGFHAGTTVTIGGSSATVTAINDTGTQITATTPAGGAAAADVVVTNSVGQSATLAGAYSYPPPTISSVSPTSGSIIGGTALTITGTNFDGGTPVVTVNGVAATLIDSSATEITAITPPGTAGGATVVVSSVGQTATSSAYTYVNTTSCSPAPALNVPITCTGVGLTDVAVPAGAIGANIVLVGGGGSGGYTSNTGSDSGAGGNGAELDANVAMAGISTLSVRVGYGGAFGRGGTYSSVSNGATPLVIAGGGGAGGRGANSNGDAGGRGGAASTLAGGAGSGALGGGGGTGGNGGTAASGGVNGQSWAAGGLGGFPGDSMGSRPGGGDGYGGGGSGYIDTGFSGGGGGAGGSYVISGTSFSIDPATGSPGSGSPGTGGAARSRSTGLGWGTAGEPGQVTIRFIPGPAPTVTGISPASGARAGGTPVTITGTGFQTGASVSIGGASASSVTVVSSTQITAITPVGGSAAADVVVTNIDAQSGTLAGGFAYAPPTISSINPTDGTTAGGTTVTVSGTGFIAPITITVGGANATNVNIASQTSLTFDTPAGAAGPAVDVVLTSVGQSVTESSAFTYSNPLPTITSFTPTSGSKAGGDAVVITGTGFLTGAAVTFDGVSSPSVTVDSATQITAITPGGTSATAVVVVTNTDSNSVTAGSTYAYINPSISSISPTSGTTSGGTTVTINGAGLMDASNVFVDGDLATIVSNTSNQIVITTPSTSSGPGPVLLQVDVAGNTATTNYQYTSPAPLISNVSPNSGPTAGNTSVTITGTDLGGASSVTFALNPATIVSNTPTEIVVISPPGSAGAAQIQVTVGAQSATANFAYGGVPQAPIDLSATPLDQGASISFTAGSDGGSQITDYEYQVDSSFWQSAGTDSSPVTVTGLSNGTTYSIRLRAVNANGEGVASSSITVTPVGSGARPGAPASLDAVPGDAALVLSWTAPNPGDSPISDYEFSTDGSTWVSLLSTNTSATISTDSSGNGLMNGQPYSVQIRAMNSDGAGTASSAVTQTPGVPLAPQNPSATWDEDSLNLQWTAGNDNGDPITDYRLVVSAPIARSGVLMSRSGPGTYTTSSTSYTVTGLNPGFDYTITFTARNGRGWGLSTTLTTGEGGSSTAPSEPAYAQFTFRLPNGSECSAISPVRVRIGTTYELPGVDAPCQLIPGSRIDGWTIPVPSGFTGAGSSSLPFHPGQTVDVSGSQQFTAVLWEPVITLYFNANVALDDPCDSNNIEHSSADGRGNWVWVPREMAELARFPETASCSPPGYQLDGWNTLGNGSGDTFGLAAPLPTSWRMNRPNKWTLYAMWRPL